MNKAKTKRGKGFIDFDPEDEGMMDTEEKKGDIDIKK